MVPIPACLTLLYSLASFRIKITRIDLEVLVYDLFGAIHLNDLDNCTCNLFLRELLGITPIVFQLVYSLSRLRHGARVVYNKRLLFSQPIMG